MPSNPSILLQPSTETFSQSFSFYFLLTLRIVVVSQLNTGLVGLTRMTFTPVDEGWSDRDPLGLDCSGWDDIKHSRQAAHQADQADQGYEPHHHTNHQCARSPAVCHKLGIQNLGYFLICHLQRPAPLALGNIRFGYPVASSNYTVRPFVKWKF